MIRFLRSRCSNPASRFAGEDVGRQKSPVSHGLNVARRLSPPRAAFQQARAVFWIEEILFLRARAAFVAQNPLFQSPRAPFWTARAVF